VIARDLAKRYPSRTVGRLLSVPRSSLLYKGRSLSDLEQLSWLIKANLVTFPTFGFRRMYMLLVRQRAACTRAEVRKVYQSLNILGKKAPLRLRTTDSRHEEARYPNLVKDLLIERPNQVWVADTTYLKVAGRTAYLALVEDAFTRRVLGWSVGFTNDANFVLVALELALARGRPEIHHSDQGKPYAAKRHTARLQPRTLISMAAVGKAWENGLAERLNRTFKEEEIRRSDYESLTEARESIRDYVAVYNERRIHMSLGYKTPNEVYRAHLNDQLTKGITPSK
jgi:putative transposase